MTNQKCRHPLDVFAERGLKLVRGLSNGDPLHWLKGLRVEKLPGKHGVKLIPKEGKALYIGWPDRVPSLKTWAGQQTLHGICKDRIAALKGLKDEALLLTFSAPCGGSGFDERSLDPIDVGFSPNDLGMEVVWYVGKELLAVIGLEKLPLLVFPDRTMAYRNGDKWVRFKKQMFGQYRGRWVLNG